MSFAIGHVVLGIPVSDQLTDYLNRKDTFVDLEDIGGVELYSASGSNNKGYFGIELRKIDELSPVDLYKNPLPALYQVGTPQLEEVNRAIKDAYSNLKTVLDEDETTPAEEKEALLATLKGKRSIWLVWSNG